MTLGQFVDMVLDSEELTVDEFDQLHLLESDVTTLELNSDKIRRFVIENNINKNHKLNYICNHMLIRCTDYVILLLKLSTYILMKTCDSYYDYIVRS